MSAPAPGTSPGDLAFLADPRTFVAGVPHDAYARLRAASPVARVEEPALLRASSAGAALQTGWHWAVLSHAGIVEASRRSDVFSSAERGAFLTEPRTPADLSFTRQMLLNMDAPQHRTIRRLVTAAFTPRAVQALADGVAGHARAVVAAALAKGTFDGVDDLAAEVPLRVLGDLMGIPGRDRSLLLSWSNTLTGFDDPSHGAGDVEAYRRTFAEAFAYALQVADSRRRHPSEDVVGRLATAEVDGRRLRDREFCQFWLLLVVAGNETTRHLVSGSISALLDHPEEAERLRAGQVGLAGAVEELLRYVSPILHFRRTALADTTLADQPIAQGDKVLLTYAAANRDPAVFADPDRLDLGRADNPHLAFGTGPHFCLGAHLARLELTAVLTELLPHLARLRRAGPELRLASSFVNGRTRLPLAVDPQPPRPPPQPRAAVAGPGGRPCASA